ncbi:MAG TPA: ATP-binding protein [Solirubrobacteraceae bacterium]|nr:ATP-binding protein [Solirubrobacteraceae bacterium]
MSNKTSAELALSWSGGKDSALALWALRWQSGLRPSVLITTVTETYDRVSMHGVRRELLREQAQLTGAKLVEVPIPPGCANSLYEERMAQAFAGPLREIRCVASGDLFLEDVRAYRETRLRAIGREALFPLWLRDTSALAREFVDAGFRAILVCVDPAQLDPSFAGREFDAQLLADLPPEVDPCGENGEFHTFVHAGPIFPTPVRCETGEVVNRDGFTFCDVVPASA